VDVGLTAPHFLFSGFRVGFLPDLDTELATRVAELGYELVELRQGGTARRPLLQVRIERPEGAADRGVTVDDCGRVSRGLEAWLDGTVIGGGQYVLEVSSPGMDRPLRRAAEWTRFAGRLVDVLVPSLHGRFQARIVAVVDGPEPAVELEFPKGERHTVPLSAIKEARLAIEW
jgi:ribosome maturation factor RimP